MQSEIEDPPSLAESKRQLRELRARRVELSAEVEEATRGGWAPHPPTVAELAEIDRTLHLLRADIARQRLPFLESRAATLSSALRLVTEDLNQTRAVIV